MKLKAVSKGNNATLPNNEKLGLIINRAPKNTIKQAINLQKPTVSPNITHPSKVTKKASKKNIAIENAKGIY